MSTVKAADCLPGELCIQAEERLWNGVWAGRGGFSMQEDQDAHCSIDRMDINY